MIAGISPAPLTFEAYADLSNVSWKNSRLKGSAVMGFFHLATKYAGEAGEFNEHLGKSLRDDPDTLNLIERLSVLRFAPERRAALLKELGDGLWYIARLAEMLDSTLAEVAQINIDKTCDRHERGVMGGDGDNR